MTPCYILKRTFTKVNLLNYPNNLGGVLSCKPDYHKTPSPLPPSHYNDTVLYSKTNFYKSQPPQLPQQFEGGAISQTGLPQNFISTSPSPITVTPCYILKRTFTKVNLLNYPNNLGGGGAISQTGLPQNSVSTSPSPITMTPCYILKQTFTKVNLLNYPNNGGVLSRKPDYHKTPSPLPPPHYNDTVLYSKTNFYKSQPLQLPQQFDGGAISQTGLPQNSISTSPSPITVTPCYILKQTFTKVNLLNYPNNWGGCYLANRITTKLHLHFPLPITVTPCYILKQTFTKVNLLNYPNNWGGAISQTGLPQNSISTSPSPITMTPCYILKRTFTKSSTI